MATDAPKPITRIRLINSKRFADSGDIPIVPLTLIFGRNNTGKSTILHSLLLLRQSLDDPSIGPRLKLAGPIYPSGSYADIVHQHKTNVHVEVQFTVRLDESFAELYRLRAREPRDIELEFASSEPDPPKLYQINA